MSIKLEMAVRDLAAMMKTVLERLSKLEGGALGGGADLADNADTSKPLADRVAALEAVSQEAAMNNDQISALQAELFSLKKRMTDAQGEQINGNVQRKGPGRPRKV